MKRYTILVVKRYDIDNAINEMEEIVMHRSEAGWELLGGPIITKEDGICKVYQAMTKNR